MAPAALEKEDKARDAAFNKAMHGNSAKAKGGISAMFSKGADAKKAAVDEYFKHWDNKPAENETAEERAVSDFQPPHFEQKHEKRGENPHVQSKLDELELQLNRDANNGANRREQPSMPL